MPSLLSYIPGATSSPSEFIRAGASGGLIFFVFISFALRPPPEALPDGSFRSTDAGNGQRPCSYPAALLGPCRPRVRWVFILFLSVSGPGFRESPPRNGALWLGDWESGHTRAPCRQ